jgi:hypothetical protein
MNGSVFVIMHIWAHVASAIEILITEKNNRIIALNNKIT